MYSDDAVLQLIDLVYGAADADRWPALLKRLAELLNGNIATIHHQQLTSMESNFAADWNMDPAAIDVYTKYYSPLNVWFTTRQQVLAQGHVYPDEILCPFELLVRTEFYNDWLKPNKMRYGLGAVIFKSGPATSCLSVFREKLDGRLARAILAY